MRFKRLHSVVISVLGRFHTNSPHKCGRGVGAPVVNLYKKGEVYFDVVAPPISSGILKPCLSISLATWIISSSDGVISPDKPMMSAFSAMAVCRIFSHGVITPRSITLQTKWQKQTVHGYLRPLKRLWLVETCARKFKTGNQPITDSARNFVEWRYPQGIFT